MRKLLIGLFIIVASLGLTVTYKDYFPLFKQPLVIATKQTRYDKIMKFTCLALDQKTWWGVPEVYIVPQKNVLELYEAAFGKDPDGTVLGIYSHDSNSVYITNDKDSCWTDAIIAHEFTHHIQHFTQPKEFWGSIVAEGQAYAVGDAYMRSFCGRKSMSTGK